MVNFEKVTRGDPEREQMGEQFGSFAEEFQRYFFPQGDFGFIVKGKVYNHEEYAQMRSKFVGSVVKIKNELVSGTIATLEEAIDKVAKVYADLFVKYEITPLSEGQTSLAQGQEFVERYSINLRISQALQSASPKSLGFFEKLFGEVEGSFAVARANLGEIQRSAEQQETPETMRFGEFCEEFEENFFPDDLVPLSFTFTEPSEDKQVVYTRFKSNFRFARTEIESQVRSGEMTVDQAIEELVMRRFVTLLSDHKIWISIQNEPDSKVRQYLTNKRVWLHQQVRDAVLNQMGLSANDRDNPRVGNVSHDVKVHIFNNIIVD